MRVVGSSQPARRSSQALGGASSFPALCGETPLGGQLRRDAFEQSCAALDKVRGRVVSSLCGGVWSAVVGWMREVSRRDDPEAPVRVAVVRPGFCEGTRRWATDELEGSSSSSRTRVVTLSPELADDDLPLEQEDEPVGHPHDNSAMLVVADAEACDPRRLCELLSRVAASQSIIGVGLLAASHWELPTSLPTSVSSRLFARDFAMPRFAAFADSLLTALPPALPVAVGPRVVAHWLDGPVARKDARGWLSRLRFLLFAFFSRRRLAYAACADSLEVAADAEQGDEGRTKQQRKLLLASFRLALSFRALATLCVAMADAALRLASGWADNDKGLAASWTRAYACLGASSDDLGTALAALDRALRLLDRTDPTRSPQLAALVGRWHRLLIDASPCLLVPPASSSSSSSDDDAAAAAAARDDDDDDDDADTQGHTPAEAAHFKALRFWASRLAQLEALAVRFQSQRLEAPRRRQLNGAVLSHFLSLASYVRKGLAIDRAAPGEQQPRRVTRTQRGKGARRRRTTSSNSDPPTSPANLVFFDDVAVIAKPFDGTLWSATISALDASAKDLRGLAFQVAADESNLDVQKWYKHLQRKKLGTSHADDDDDQHGRAAKKARACQFACVVRDLSYTGLVRDHTKRGKFIVSGV